MIHQATLSITYTALHGAAQLQGTRVTLVEAIATAEQKTGGQAYDAGMSTNGGKTHIVVEISGPKGAQTVSIDPQNGQITETHAHAEQDW